MSDPCKETNADTVYDSIQYTLIGLSLLGCLPTVGVILRNWRVMIGNQYSIAIFLVQLCLLIATIADIPVVSVDGGNYQNGITLCRLQASLVFFFFLVREE